MRNQNASMFIIQYGILWVSRFDFHKRDDLMFSLSEKSKDLFGV